eukprot:gene7311-8508_t
MLKTNATVDIRSITEKNEQGPVKLREKEEVLADIEALVEEKTSIEGKIASLERQIYALEDLYSNKLSLEDLEKEVARHLAVEGDAIFTSCWRCHNLQTNEQAKQKQASTNEVIDAMWQEIQVRHPVSSRIIYKEFNVHETVSMSLVDEAPAMYRVAADVLNEPPINLDLVKAASILNKLVRNQWIDSTVDQLLALDDRASQLVTQDPYLYMPYAAQMQAKDSSINNTDMNRFIAQMFDAINALRQYKDLATMQQKKVGPNDVCPCKSTKKFKKCHGALNTTSKFYLFYPAA